MKVAFYNIGCKVNYAELSEIQKQFIRLGAEVVEFGSPCDAVIINTCSVTNLAESDSRKIIRRAIRLNPNAFVAVIGCYAQLRPEEIEKIEGVDAIFGTKYKFSIPLLIDKFEKQPKPKVFVGDIDDELPYHTAISVDNESRTRVVLKLQDGCDYVCTYCTIPLARGKSRSLPFNSLREKLLQLNETEYEEIVLSGINLGEYHSPNGEKFTDVLRLIENLNLKQRFRISSIEPNKVTDEIIDIVAQSSKICPHFHIPLQSGSNEILRLMKRRYNTERYRELIFKIKDKIPHCAIGIDVITGFPGETDELFEETYEFLQNLPFSYLHVFTYSERDNTPAAEMPNPVAKEIRKERTNILRKLSELKRYQFYSEQLGELAEVIPEEYNPSTNLWKGWTENYIRCEIQNFNSTEKKRVKVRLEKVLGETVLAIAIE